MSSRNRNANRTSNPKDVKNINVKIPKSLGLIKTDIETVISKNETVIMKYLEDFVYTVDLDLNKELKSKIEKSFKNVRKNIMEGY